MRPRIAAALAIVVTTAIAPGVAATPPTIASTSPSTNTTATNQSHPHPTPIRIPADPVAEGASEARSGASANSRLPPSMACPLPDPENVSWSETVSENTTPRSNTTSSPLTDSYNGSPESPIPDAGALNASRLHNGLPVPFVAALFSRDNDSRAITESAFRDRYGRNRTALGWQANHSDVVFDQPPGIADVWTRNAHDQFTPGGWHTSVHPRGAALANGSVGIRDAHASIFLAHPSTVVHYTPNDTRRYLAPNGTLRALVDYRLTRPSNRTVANPSENDTRELWCIDAHGVSATAWQNDSVIGFARGQTPQLSYSLQGEGSTALTLEAVVRALFYKRVDRYVCRETNTTESETTVDNTTESEATTANTTGDECGWEEESRSLRFDYVAVSDTIHGQVYDPSARAYAVDHPGGDRSLALRQSAPLAGVTVTGHRNRSVHGVWQFYTARDPEWDVLVRSNGTGRAAATSPAVPVSVHAYPARAGLERSGPGPLTVTHTWGETRTATPTMVGDNVSVGVRDGQYTTTTGLAIRFRNSSNLSPGRITPETLTVQGIVYNTTSEVTVPWDGPRAIHEANLTAEVVASNRTAARVKLTLVDAETGAPIELANESARGPFQEVGSTEGRDGYISIAGKRVETNESGVAYVTVTRPGQVEARYVPESWVSVKLAYAETSTTVSWHPLADASRWLQGGFRLGLLIGVLYLCVRAGRYAARIISVDHY